MENLKEVTRPDIPQGATAGYEQAEKQMRAMTGLSGRQQSAYELELRSKLANREQRLRDELRQVREAQSQLNNETVQAVLNVISEANK